jgi:hypothetical protein
VPQKIVSVAQLIIVRYAKIVGFRRTSRIVATDINNSPVDHTVWLGSSKLAIDIQMSHLSRRPELAHLCFQSGSLAENFAFVLETAVPPPKRK